mmetsp:Transcript_14346/g.40760  ORF Transcript_14346/g.40760 Transcript_14346/m.40760 type:complete len:106 (-) Transcript_14346:65-382(-)
MTVVCDSSFGVAVRHGDPGGVGELVRDTVREVAASPAEAAKVEALGERPGCVLSGVSAGDAAANGADLVKCGTSGKVWQGPPRTKCAHEAASGVCHVERGPAGRM